ncbi:hypothetical protein LSH36_2g18029 [Paralvinella palmiformis]|uniref:Protein YIPF n=1 Tax=Paralvinella palmiformis TaxID=53620 RepID=A0AAD9KF93_9ANNE|nr:hypothetical protein LSH36_2g18029 [Paralvinella palmiformis]
MADVERMPQHLLASMREDSDEVLLDTSEYFHHKSSDALNEVSLEGDITVPGAPEEENDELNTLDEPVKDTVMRDLRAVGQKFLHVLMLQGSTEKANDLNDGGPQFAEVFVIYWVGAAIVTLNTKLLGGSISFFQSICVLGYCVLPLTIVLIVCRLILIAQPQTTALFVIRCVIVLLAFGWSTFASTAFLAESQPPRRKALAIYPIFLFYFIISWLVISHTHH